MTKRNPTVVSVTVKPSIDARAGRAIDWVKSLDQYTLINHLDIQSILEDATDPSLTAISLCLNGVQLALPGGNRLYLRYDNSITRSQVMYLEHTTEAFIAVNTENFLSSVDALDCLKNRFESPTPYKPTRRN